MKIQIYRCFGADKRISMDVVADSLEKGLRANSFDVSNFRPESIWERFGNNRHVMRYLRYVQYPRAVKNAVVEADIHHVIDHGYAHLHPSLGDGCKVISVYDLIPLLTWKGVIETGANPQTNNEPTQTEVRKPRLNLYSLSFLNRYDRIVSSSQNTANDLSKYLGVPSDKVVVVPPVLDSIFAPASETKVAQFRQKYRLDSKSKWVMISGREYYKNHATSLQVLMELIKNSEHDIKIVKTGLASPEFDQLVERYQLEDQVLTLFLEDRNELPALYSAVDCLLFPSLYEGFGMPVAEALACGTPAVISNRGSLPEVGGGLTPSFDAFSVFEFANAVSVALFDETCQRTMLARGPVAMRKYSNENVGRAFTEVYNGLMANGR